MSFWFVVITISTVPYAPGYLFIDIGIIVYLIFYYYKKTRPVNTPKVHPHNV